MTREPFDGTVPIVLKLSIYTSPHRWYAAGPGIGAKSFATWREAMDYALGLDTPSETP